MSNLILPRLDRRDFLKTGAVAGAALAVGVLRASPVRAEGEAALPPLPYAFDALEPSIDAKTMEIHHDKHHAAYVKNLNDKLKDHADLQKLPIEELLANKAEKVPEAIRQAVINNGGGHYNHSLFWTVLGPKAGGEPKGTVAEAIKSTFGDFDKFKAKMKDAGVTRFGSGWSWLVKTGDGKLEVYSTANQDCPIMEGKTPLFGIDVWEHAYYLKYQNLRANYIDAIWNVVNWDEVQKRFAK
jgi:Fe-Mn family superoxide dismutase